MKIKLNLLLLIIGLMIFPSLIFAAPTTPTVTESSKTNAFIVFEFSTGFISTSTTYVSEYKATASSTYIDLNSDETASTTSTFSKTITSLDPETSYDIIVVATDTTGTATSTVLTITTHPNALAPTLVSTTTNSVRTVVFDLTTEAIATSTEYKIYYKASTTTSFPTSPTETITYTTPGTYQQTISSLSADNTDYNIQVIASSYGDSAVTLIDLKTNLAIPNPKNTDVTYDSLKMSWSTVSGAGVYDLCYKEKATSTYNTIDGNITDIFKTITGLSYNTDYNIKVRACLMASSTRTCDDTPVEGCSDFNYPRAFKTDIYKTVATDIETLKIKYEKQNLNSQKKFDNLKKYIDDVSKLKEIATTTQEDLKSEVLARKTELEAEYVTVKNYVGIDPDYINLKYSELKELTAYSTLGYKKRTYSQLSQIYQRIDRYKEKISLNSAYKTTFDDLASSSITFYRDNSVFGEATIMAVDLPWTQEKLNILKDKYKSLKEAKKYKYYTLIYKFLNYLERTSTRFAKLEDKVTKYSKQKISETVKDAYLKNIVNVATTTYYSYLDTLKWDDVDNYTAVNDQYKEMQQYEGYKLAIRSAKLLYKINRILVNTEKIYNEIYEDNAFIQSEADIKPEIKYIFSEIEASASTSVAIINREMNGFADRSTVMRIIEQTSDEFSEFDGYTILSSYFYSRGHKKLNKLLIKYISTLSGAIDAVEINYGISCTLASTELTSAMGHAIAAKNHLLEYPKTTDISTIKNVHYVRYKEEYQLAYTDFQESRAALQDCLK